MRITLTPFFPYLVEQMEAEMDPRWKENRFFWSVQTDLFPIDTFTFSDICSSSQAMKVIQLWRKNLFFFGSISSRLNPRFFKEGGTLKPLELNRNINLGTTNWEDLAQKLSYLWCHHPSYLLTLWRHQGTFGANLICLLVLLKCPNFIF